MVKSMNKRIKIKKAILFISFRIGFFLVVLDIYYLTSSLMRSEGNIYFFTELD